MHEKHVGVSMTRIQHVQKQHLATNNLNKQLLPNFKAQILMLQVATVKH